MNILKVIPVFAPAWQAGGPVHVVYSLACELVKRKHNIYVYTTNFLDTKNNFSFSKREYLFKGIHVTYFKNYLRWNGVLFSPYMIKSFMKDFRGFDIVHLHTYRGFQDIMAFLSKIVGIPYILQTHGSLHRIGKEKLKLIYDTFVGRRILKNASKIIALSALEAKQYRRMGVPEEKITLIPNGIDLSEYADLPPKGSFRKKFGVPEDKKVILYLGRIHRIKGIDFLLKAYAYLIEKIGCKDAVLVIAGPDDGYLSGAKALANSLRISDSALFVGPLYGGDKLAAYVDSDLCVLPSRYEMFPMALLEMYACGKPIVASNIRGLRELIIDGETGLLFESGNFKQMAEKMLSLLNDSDKAVEIGRKARMLVEEKYSMDKVVDELEELYIEVALQRSSKC
jgi:glycosyltransferase involved in cell wall biosynthesis